MDLTEAMTAFVRASERGSFSAAARDLSVTQPHITRAVQQLEARLGVRLLNRTTRRLTLTDEGTEYLARCRSILDAIEDADHSVGARADTLRGKLRVFAPVSLGRAWIVPRLKEFLDRHPALQFHLTLDDRPRDLVEERLDVGIRVGPLTEASLRVRKLGDVERWIVATPDYWQRTGHPGKPEDISHRDWLVFDGTVRIDRVLFTDLGEIPVQGRFSTNSSEAIEEALLLGLGPCWAPTWLVAKHVASGRLRRVLPEYRTGPPLELFAVYPETRVPSEKVRRFVDWLVFSLHADGLFGR